MRTICVSRKAGIEICLHSTACDVTVTTLMKVHWLILVWFERKTKPRQHKKTGSLQARDFWRGETKMEQGRDYLIPFLMHLFQPDDQDSRRRRTPHLWWWFSVNHNRCQTCQGRVSTIKSRDEHMIYRLGIGCRNKERSNRKEMDNDDLEALLPWGLTVWELYPIKATRKLILALLRASKEILEAHFQFLQDCYASAAKHIIILFKILLALLA